MKCPVDDTQLVMSERSGIEIDYCPQCRGVWLDRGELDKLIERSGSLPASARSETARPSFGRDNHDGNRTDAYGRRKKGNWLSELFD